MRHQIAGFKLGRQKDVRLGLQRTMIKQLLDHERIQTTHAKALFIRSETEKLITLARRSSKATAEQKVHARRLAASRLGDAALVKKLFDEIGPRFENRNGGYTRITKLGPRQGDAAEMVVIELVEE
jgi:large subunit ribosomal protein L17